MKATTYERERRKRLESRIRHQKSQLQYYKKKLASSKENKLLFTGIEQGHSDISMALVKRGFLIDENKKIGYHYKEEDIETNFEYVIYTSGIVHGFLEMLETNFKDEMAKDK